MSPHWLVQSFNRETTSQARVAPIGKKKKALEQCTHCAVMHHGYWKSAMPTFIRFEFLYRFVTLKQVGAPPTPNWSMYLTSKSRANINVYLGNCGNLLLTSCIPYIRIIFKWVPCKLLEVCTCMRTLVIFVSCSSFPVAAEEYGYEC